jgi:hypothetical protein
MSVIRLAPAPGTYAELGFGADTSHVNLDSVMQAVVEGPDGSLINIETAGDAGGGDGVTFEVDGYDILCHFEDGVSTVEDFETALAADAAVAALVRVKTAGTAASVLTDADDTQSAALLTGGGATSVSAPGDADDGTAAPHLTDEAVLIVRSVAGSGTMTATPILYGWHPELRCWIKVYTSSALAETGSDTIAAQVALDDLYPYSRFAVELSVGGTGTEVGVYLHCRPASFQSA